MHWWCCLQVTLGACHLQVASPVLYTTNCKHSLVLLMMGEIIARNMLSWFKLLIKLLLLHLVGCLYQWCTVTQTSNLFLLATRRLLTKHNSQGWQSDVGDQPLLSHIHLNQLRVIEFIHRWMSRDSLLCVSTSLFFHYTSFPLLSNLSFSCFLLLSVF